MLYRIYAYKGQVSAIALGKEFVNANGLEVDSGETEDMSALLAAKAPNGVGSPWPPVDSKPSTKTPKK